MGKIYDLVIIGSGPAGLTAAIYAERAKLDTIVIEKNYVSGGQVINTYEVDNYPGLQGINGFDMGIKFREHADALGAKFINVQVESIYIEDSLKKIKTSGGVYEARTVIIATGARYRKLQIPGEEEFSGMGVSYCATCDGAFFKNKVTVVNGGGDVAVEDAIFLSRICSKVYLIHRRDSLRAAKSLQEKLFSIQNIEVIWNHTVKEINGDTKVKSILIKDNLSKTERILDVDGIFIAVGILPNTDEFKSLTFLDEQNYIKAGEDCVTEIPGVFAAGDVRTKMLRQIITAAGDGANAVASVQEYLNKVWVEN